MAAEIKAVAAGSPAHRVGIKAGELLIAIDGHIISDVLDYKFYSYERSLSLKVGDLCCPRDISIKKSEGEDLGLDFETYLMDEQKSCSNRCVFCFIDQLPKGMRSTLYFKDDDARLSFLVGNYISMTNLSDADAKRICDMRVSPLNISVHTTNPVLRSKMLGNVRGGEALRHLKTFCDAKINIHCQIVLCPGYNDGRELEKTLFDLCEMYPSVDSVAVVPVGLTRHREGLCELSPVDVRGASEAIRIIDAQRKKNLEKYGIAICCAADEMYLKAGHRLPPPGYYEDYSQLENGVGLMSLFEDELMSALACEEGPLHIEPFTVATGESAAPFIRRMIDEIAKKCDNKLIYNVIAVRNDFFGHGVNVAGLICGCDIIEQLRGKITGSRVFIPQCMLRHGETVFLDDVTIAQVQDSISAEVVPVEIDGGILLDALLER